MSYRVGPGPLLPEELSELQDYLSRELEKIQVAFTLMDFIRLKVYTVEPQRPRDGQVVFADGVEWNPGSGEGFYGYYNSTWNKL